MNTLEEIKHALEQLPAREQEAILQWLDRLIRARQVSLGIEEPQPAYTPQISFMTLAEYMEFEEESPFRHEYVNGVVRAMSGARLQHGRIAKKLLLATDAHLGNGPCEAFSSDNKLHIRLEAEEVIYYPDMMIACNPEEWEKNCIVNPKLVAEVLSASTRHIDHGEKAMTYRRVISIEEYVLIEQDEYRVTVHRRADGWRPEVYCGADATAEFRSVSLSIPLSRIYAGTLPPA